MSDTQTPASSGDEPYDEETQFEESQQIVTNDAVAGETVIDNGHYAGATGSEPEEIEPEAAGNDLENSVIDLEDLP